MTQVGKTSSQQRNTSTVEKEQLLKRKENRHILQEFLPVTSAQSSWLLLGPLGRHPAQHLGRTAPQLPNTTMQLCCVAPDSSSTACRADCVSGTQGCLPVTLCRAASHSSSTTCRADCRVYRGLDSLIHSKADGIGGKAARECGRKTPVESLDTLVGDDLPPAVQDASVLGAGVAVDLDLALDDVWWGTQAQQRTACTSGGMLTCTLLT